MRLASTICPAMRVNANRAGKDLRGAMLRTAAQIGAVDHISASSRFPIL